MRPQQLSRGNSDPVPHNPPPEPLASMKPQQLSRGNWVDVAELIAFIIASMRPQQLSRGNLGRWSRKQGRPTCFNEAPAVKPGKSERARTRRTAQSPASM